MNQNTSSPMKISKAAMALLPFADAASHELPLGRLLRLALFQVSVGMAMVLLSGTLNRVMVVELGTPTWVVALLIAVPLLIAPFRALIGHRSDRHISALGWRRVPYIWFGTLMQFGGLAIMPFALLHLSRPENFAIGMVAAAVAFLLTGTGFHVTQTAGLALATDLAPEDKRPRAVALLYVMLLVGMMLSAFVIGGLLIEFSPTRLVQVIQGAAVITMLLNLTALWKQEARAPDRTKADPDAPSFGELWNAFVRDGRNARLLTAIGIGAAAFAMQDALLEPYGGEILGLSVGATTGLTGAWAFGALLGFHVVRPDACWRRRSFADCGSGACVRPQRVFAGGVRIALCLAHHAVCRRGDDRTWSWAVFSRHFDRGDEPCEERDRWSGFGRLGRGASDMRRRRYCAWRYPTRPDCRLCNERRSCRSRGHTRHRLHLCLCHRNPAAFGRPRRDRTACRTRSQNFNHFRKGRGPSLWPARISDMIARDGMARSSLGGIRQCRL